MDKKVMIGCPVRNRDWVIEDYLRCIINLNYKKELISLAFVVNDSEDNTLNILKKFKNKMYMKYRDIRIKEINKGFIKDKRVSSVRKKIYNHLADMRNEFLDMKRDEDYVFSVDSDILIKKDTLKRLVKYDKDIISSLIWNNKNKTVPNIMNKDYVQSGNTRYRHLKEFDKDVFQVDVTGACYLLKSEVVDNVTYSYHIQGEDIGFCEDAKRKGYEIWTNTFIECQHIMNIN